MEENVYVVLIKVQGVIYLMVCPENNSVQAFETEAEAVGYFEDGYNESHKLGYTHSVSATINSITFNPSIIKSPSIEFIRDTIVSEKPELFNLHHVSGHMKGLKTKPGVDKYWEDGNKPRIISEKSYE